MLMRLISKAGGVLNRFYDCIGWFIGALICFAMLVVTYDVTMRYLMNRPLPWTTEITGDLLVYVTFLGAPWVLTFEGGHVSIDIVVKWLSPRAQLVIKEITSMTGAVVGLLVARYAAQSAWELYLSGYYLETTLEIPIFHLHAVISIGSFLVFVQFLRNAYGYHREFKILSGLEPGEKRNFRA